MYFIREASCRYEFIDSNREANIIIKMLLIYVYYAAVIKVAVNKYARIALKLIRPMAVFGTLLIIIIFY